MLFKKLRFLSLVLVLGFSQHLYSQNVGKTSLNVSATGSKFASTVTPVPATTTPVQGCDEPEPDPCDGNTFTQGAWGAGNNNPASTYLNSYFSTYFPNGLTIGCGSRQLKLTSAAAVFAFLPSGSTPAILPTGTLTNPGGAYSNVLAGQLVALTLNMGFDANNAGFSPSAHSLANYTITSGTFSGMSVNAFLNLANSIIGGCSSQYSYSQLNTAATTINENYDNNSSNGFLVCPPVCNITVTAVSGSISCFSGNTNVTITATGGTAPYTGTGVFSRPAGVHSFTVSDIYGCQSVKTKTLTQPSQLVATASNGSISCYGGTASICVNASGGTPPYSGTGTFTRTAGVHSFTVTDSKGCTSVVSKVLTQPAQINVSATNGSISCYGGTATICVNASGGTAPYSGTGTFTRTAGVHSFTVTDNKGCTAVITRTLTQPAQLIVSATNGSISCYGGTATICVNASGGTAPYTGTGTFTRTTGIHSFTVTDYKGCTAVITKTLTQPSQLLATASNGSIFCYGGTATICVNASGGTPPYSGTGTFTRAAGIQTFTVTDSKGCTAVLTKTLTEPAQLTVTATNGNISCYGGTATICINATGGSAPYTGTGTFTRTAGVHSFTVTDNKGCASVITKTLSQPTPLTVSATNGTISCYGGTATICVNASGGTAPYTGTGTFTRTAGVHSFTVTDSNGCTAIVTKTITQVAPLNVSINSSNGTCNNSNLGSSTLVVSGGSAPYSYLWSNTATTSVVNGLSAGTYTAWVTDANACTGSSTTSISVVACCNVTSPGSISGSTTSCGSLCNLTFGSNAPASGGIGTVQYLWIRNSQPNYPNTGNNGWVAIPNSNSPTLAVGCVTATTYYIRCSRNSGCSQFIGESNMLSVIIHNTPSLTISTSSLLCNGGSATATVSASGGTAPYTGTGIFTLNAGPYSYTVSDANGCSASANGSITQVAPLNISINSSNGTCNNSNLGSSTLVVSGGSAPYSYLWSNTATTSVINGLSAGTYTAWVTDANACTGSSTTSISVVACCNVTSPGSISGSTTSCGSLCNLTFGSNAPASGGIGTVQYLWIRNSQPNYPNTGNNGWVAIPNSNSPTLAVGCVTATTYYIRCSRNSGCSQFIGESNMLSVIINNTPSLTISTSSLLCNGGSATATVSASGGTAPYTGTGIFTLNAGPYSYTVTDANGCSASANGNITQASALTVSSSNGTINCYGGTTTVNISANGGTAPYTGTGTYTLSAGSYSFVVTDANGCSSNINGNIAQPSVLSASAVNGNIHCNGGTTTVNVTANGGTAPYTGTGNFTVNAGPYSFTVTDSKGCTSIASGNITQASALTVSSSNGTINCYGGTTTINISANGGTAPYTGTGTFTRTAGVHSFTVSDSQGCTALITKTLSQPSQLTASAVSGTIACGGTTTVNISASGGTAPYTGVGIYTVIAGPYTFTVSDAGACTAVVNGTITQPSALSASAVNGNINCNGGTTTVNISANGGTPPYTGTGTFTRTAGPYTFTVSDANGCSTNVNGNISQPSALSASAVNGTINCNGGTTTVNVSANGGTAPYTGTGTYTLSAGTYSFIVTDANGCSSNVNGNIVQPSILSASAINGNINCNGGTTTVNVTANGGTAPYTGTGNFTVNAGPYSFTVTDSKGCSAIASGSISQPTALNVSALHGTINCNGGTTTINISANGGTSPYTGTGTYTLSAGSYSFVVTDANGCSSNVNGNIAQPSVLSASAVNGNINCNGGTTTVNVTANGGTSPYTGTGNFTVNAGPYSFTVTDSKGCSAIASGSISQPSALTVSSSNGTINCYGGTTTINISANGGTAPYTGTGTFTRTAGVHSFTVSDSQGCTALITKTLSQPSQLTASAISGTIACGGTTTVNVSASGGTAPYTGVGIYTVIAGPYTFTVSDAGACTAVVNGTITQPSALSASAVNGNINCNGGTTTVNISANGGTPPYTGTGTFTRTAGPYTFTVSDANGCSTNVNGNISQPSALSASAVNGTINCNGGTTTVNVSANGGTAPYTGTGTYTLSAGTYSFIVTDANGCSSNVNGNIVQPSILSASAINGNINCNGGTTTVNVTANGGTAPYTGTGNFTVNAGPYSFTVTDSKGCSAIASGSISQPTALNVSALHGTINCNGGTTTINISANGGTSPYTGTGIFTVSAGSYSFVVTDANGCSSNVNGNIAQPSVLSASAVNGNINCNGGTTTVNVTANGGTAPYTGTGNFTVNAGPYSFTVTDSKGCTSIASGNISQPSALTASSNNGTINCYGGTTTINISANGGTAPYTGTGNYSVSAGSYSFVVTDANGCTSNVNGNITQPSVLGASAVNGSINCNAGTTTVNVSATGGTAPYTGTGNFTLSAGPFTYTVSDANGCLAIASGSVSQPSALSITALNGTINCNGGSTTVNISAFGGTAPYTGTGSFSVNAGPFSYTVSDANGCSAIANGIISEPSALIVSSNNGTINCNAGTTTVNVSVTGGTAPYTGTGNFTVNAGPFTYTVNDANGCFAIASGSISQPAPLNTSVLSGNINCNGGTTTLNISATGGTAPYTGTGIFTVNAGPYTYTVTDANSCSSIASGTISQPGALSASSIQGTINCNGGTTTVTISANGGTAPYTGTGNFTVNAGPFSYTVSDANACISIASGTITQPGALSASSIQGTIICNGGATTVNVSAIGGTAPYTGTGNFTVNAGPFTYTVNDANGCFAIASGSISQPAPLNSSVLSGNINCNGGSTTLNISATGGTAPYTGTGIFTVNAGPYSYTVTDANSCSSIASGIITQPNALSASSIQGTINCNGGTTTVNVSATGGTAPYTGTGNFTVSAGPFTYTVNDANGCFAIAGGTITQPGALSASSIQGTINCNAGTTTVTVSAIGGTAPYTGTGNFTVNAGPYSFTVTDANGCSSIASGTISQPSALSASSNNGTINCYGGTTTINISANGGTAPYTGTGNFTLTAGPYSYTVTDANACTSVISGNINEPTALGVSLSYGSILCNGETTTLTVSASGGTFPYAGTGTYTVSAGTQTITVLDVMGCSASTVVNITQPNALNLNYSAGTILCNGSTTSATISASGGTAPYGGVGVFNVSAGIQTLTVIDAQGCTASSVVTILQPSPLVLNFVSGTISCHGGTTPATLSASGGSAPYFGTGVFIVSAGAQTLTVIDAQGCTTSSAINITEPSPLVLNFSAGNILCNGGSTSATISASGGTSPYGGTGVFVVSAGAQTLTVIDAQGCTTSTAVNITQPSPLTLTFAHDSISCHGASANATISASGGTAPYGGTGVFNIFAGTQTLTVIDAQGCTSNSVVNINQPAALSINFAADSILCNGGSASATITASGGTSPYGGTGTYTLSAGVQTLVVIDAQGCITSSAIALTEPAPIAISVLADSILCNGGSAYVLVNASGGVAPYNGTGLFLESSGIHTYTVSDANGCINSSVINLTEPTLLVGTFLADSILCNGGSASTTISASGGTAPYSGTGVYILTPGFYSYQVADNNGCIVNVSRYITEPSALVATFFEDSIRCFGGYATIVVGASGGTTPYTGVGTFTAFAGNHNYIVTDSNGCSTSTILTITQPPPLVATSIVNTSILCHGDSASVTVIALGGSGSYLNMVTDSMPCMNDSLRAMLAANGGTVPYWGPDTYKVPAGTYTYGVVDSRCCWDTAQITISEPPPLFAGSILGDIACNDNPTSFTITATGGTSPYAGTGVQSMPAGSYTYQVFDANNCQDTTVVIIDTTFCTGFEETNLAEHSIMVYPNPNNGSFRISGLYKGKGQILSQSGQFIREIEFRENEEIIIENMAKGLYFLVTPELRMKIVVLSD